MTKFTKGPWRSCNDGDCSCMVIWGGEATEDNDGTHPVARVESETWGDSYPAIRNVDGGGMSGTKAEAYLEHIVYGTIPEEMAKANAKLIAAAPDLFNALSVLADACESMGIPVDAARAALAKAEGK